MFRRGQFIAKFQRLKSNYVFKIMVDRALLTALRIEYFQTRFSAGRPGVLEPTTYTTFMGPMQCYWIECVSEQVQAGC